MEKLSIYIEVIDRQIYETQDINGGINELTCRKIIIIVHIINIICKHMSVEVIVKWILI